MSASVIFNDDRLKSLRGKRELSHSFLLPGKIFGGD